MGSVNRRITVQFNQGINMKNYFKNNQNKRAGDLVQVIVCLPSRHKALK
jgi:hypothetical protein